MAKGTSWLHKYLELSEQSEVPEYFSLWCGLSALSAVVRRRVHLNLGLFKVYPNLFVVLVAGSGRCRKSTAIDLAGDMVRLADCGVNVISQKLTPEALIEALSPDQNLNATGLVLADELSTFLNRKTYEAGLASLLIPLFDCKDTFEYRTKGRGIERLDNVYLTLLAGSTIEWIRAAIPEDAVGGGLTSRILFVYEKEPRPPVAFPSCDLDLMGELIEGLVLRSQASGEFDLTGSARQYYINVYNEYQETSMLFNDPRLAGYASRRHIHILKVSMLLALSESLDLRLRKDHIDAALNLIIKTEKGMPMVLDMITASQVGELAQWVYGKIQRMGTISRTDLMRNVSHKLSAGELDEVIKTLLQSGMITQVVSGPRGKIEYKKV